MNFILTMANACVFLCLNLFLLRMTESSVSSSFNWSDITSSLECYNIKSHVYCTLENDVWGSIFIHLFDRVSVTKNVFFFFFWKNYLIPDICLETVFSLLCSCLIFMFLQKKWTVRRFWMCWLFVFRFICSWSLTNVHLQSLYSQWGFKTLPTNNNEKNHLKWNSLA